VYVLYIVECFSERFWHLSFLEKSRFLFSARVKKNCTINKIKKSSFRNIIYDAYRCDYVYSSDYLFWGIFVELSFFGRSWERAKKILSCFWPFFPTRYKLRFRVFSDPKIFWPKKVHKTLVRTERCTRILARSQWWPLSAKMPPLRK
jgi:hypothetical protein